MKYAPPILTTFRNNTTKVVLESFVQHIYPHELCIPSYICCWFPAKRSMKCKQSREINWGRRPSPFSPWFRHKAAGSVLISDLETSPVNKSDNWGGCQTNWIVAVRLRPCSERESLTIICMCSSHHMEIIDRRWEQTEIYILHIQDKPLP